MKLILFAILTLLIISPSAAQENKSNRDLILGTWEMVEEYQDTMIMFFQENDSVDFVQGEMAYKSKFRFLSDTTLLLGTRTWFVIKLSETELVLSDSEWDSPDDYDYYTRSERHIQPIKKYIDIVTYYDNGQKKLEGRLIDGFQHGLWQEWYENGQIKSESNYFFGGPLGIFKTWFENEQIQTEKKYGIPASVKYSKEWNEQGDLVKDE